ncbi:MAG TPA: [protein-PII] uridylyltransferase [Brevundimonas sp.]|jgi:[protein-PII] uridylyltransferase|uniref:[protein-PII] uridylyltransferase n=1 Tax=Brevundimonas sp. TaxID=1871086 RepID=UPI002DF2AD7A|nr:[protein-PII] uridylyltransferase [Brevundimonas sp.]
MSDRRRGPNDATRPDAWAAAAGAVDPRVAVAPLVRALLDVGRDRATRRLEAGGNGVEVARLFSQAADDAVVALWDFAALRLYPAANPTQAERLSLLAVGGYGRGVLAPHSDLDLLFLRPWKTTPRAEQVTEFVLYVLWDLGLKVGSAARSLDECLKLAKSDMTVRTALLEARPLAGDAGLADQLIDRFRMQVRKADPRPFIAAKLAERDARHAKAGAVRNRVEPNVKDGKGGLRDLNALFWIARGLSPDSPDGEATLADILTARERRLFAEAFDFLWRVRHHMHLIAGRAVESLTFDLQPEVARRMGWRGRGDEPAVERFMRRYFIVAGDVGSLTRAFSAQLEARGQKATMTLSRLFAPRPKKLSADGFLIVGGRLSVTGPQVFAADPVKLLDLFRVMDAEDLDLHPDAFAAVSRSLNLVTPQLRRNPEAARAFLDVLARGQRPYRVLSVMNAVGLLGRFLPEWGRIVGQTQFNMYHAYTVDEHTLQAVGIINDIQRGKLKDEHPLASEIVHRIADPEALMLGMLLHDVGKGGDRGQLEDGAIAARRACQRLGVEARRIELVCWLVANHLALSDTAQKRDVSDPATVRAFAETVGDPERLRMLLVLTAADVRAVGPGVFNSWKGGLMRDLFLRVDALFRGEDSGAVDPAEGFEDLLDRARASGAAADAVVDREADRHGGRATTRVAVAAPDRPRLFADLAAVLAAEGADVVGARIGSAGNGVTLDVFEVQDGAARPYGLDEPRRLSRLLARLTEAAGPASTAMAPLPPAAPNARRAAFEVRPVVAVDLDTVEDAAVVEVSGPDRPGLLAALAGALADGGWQVRSAHVAGFGERVVDAFYLTDRDGAKPRPGRRLDALRDALHAVLEAAPASLAEGRRITPVRASIRDVSDLSAGAVSRSGKAG